MANREAFPTRYSVSPDGTIQTLNIGPLKGPGEKLIYNRFAPDYPYTNLSEAETQSKIVKLQLNVNKIQDEYEQRLADVTSREGTYNTLAEQIRALGGTGTAANQVSQPQAINQSLASLGSDRNFGASDLSTRLNFQVSDEDILADYNNTKLNRLNQLVNQGNAQIAGITERLNTAQNLLNSLPSGDPRRTSSEVVVNQLKSDLASVQSGVV
ncbi:hypothetical protein EBZ39_19780, partial [bacterium]|nr:hypothetical protein [bacterium]